MRKIKLFHFSLILLIMLAYQVNTLHFVHLFEKNDHCAICTAHEKIESLLHDTPYTIETKVLENSSIIQKTNAPKVRKITQTPIRKKVDFTGLHYVSVTPIPLGYFPNAPPIALF